MTSSSFDYRTPGDATAGRRFPWQPAAWWLAAFAVAGSFYWAAIRFGEWERDRAMPPPMPCVTITRPSANETDVLPNAFVAADVYLPNIGHGIDAATMNTTSVWLERASDGARVAGNVNTSGAGDAIVFQPTDMLDSAATYVFRAEGVRDTSGALFQPFSMQFTTASAAALSEYPVAFDKTPQPTTTTQRGSRHNVFTGLRVGPDHRLYAGTYDGRILRFDIAADGSLGEPVTIDTICVANRSPSNPTGCRLLTGLRFDPASTADKPVLWVSHGVMTLEQAPDWSCKISRLSGANLDECTDYVVGLPRSWRDHLTFQMVFGPDGAMYVCQGSDTSVGAPDKKWGYRSEHLLNAACLRVDTGAISQRTAAGQGPLDVRTERIDSDPPSYQPYDPFASAAPLTLYATGVRCGYCPMWHSNGSLYVAVNGSAAGGATPGTPEDFSEVPRRIDQDRNGPYTGPLVDPIPRNMREVVDTQDDLLLRLEPGRYYGHPNATRGEYVLNGGNPTGESDPYQVRNYPVGTMPDRNWQQPVWNLGKSVSGNGLIEYKGTAFNGFLNGKMLLTRYSGGKDILLLTPGPDGKITEAVSGIDGFTQFVDPLDLTEDETSGYLYIAEFGGQRITMLKPRASGVSHRVFRRTNPLGTAGTVN